MNKPENLETQTFAETLISKAEKGERLTADQRRIAIAFLMAMRPDDAERTQQLAELFGVTSRTIREDKQIAREEIASEISEDDIGLVIADIRIAYRRFIERTEGSIKKASPGTATYLNHLKLQMDMELKYVETLQSLGYLPKNLGNLTTTKFEFKATANDKTGVVSTAPVIEGEVVERSPKPMVLLPQQSASDIEEREKLNAEFMMGVAPPLPLQANDGETKPEPTTGDTPQQQTAVATD